MMDVGKAPQLDHTSISSPLALFNTPILCLMITQEHRGYTQGLLAVD